MCQNREFKFIREKVYGLNAAVMYGMSNELIKIPNTIVTLVRMDEEGHLWFHCKAPVQFVQQSASCFPVRLHFFKKGFNYCVDVSGSAIIINTKAGLDRAENEKKDGCLLIKMNVNSIEYEEHSAKAVKQKIWFDQLFETSYRWLMQNLTLPRPSKQLLTKMQYHR